MSLKFTLVAGLAAAVSLASSFPGSFPKQHDSRICGAPEPRAEQLSTTHWFPTEEGGGSGLRHAKKDTITVEVYVHVIAADETKGSGYVTREDVNAQMRVLNDKFSKGHISFILKDVDWAVNKNWTNNGDILNRKKTLRNGSYSALNLYYVNQIGQGYLGGCGFPLDAKPGSFDFYWDGCTMLFTTMPGGSAANANEGKITVHEVGHWFGLMHDSDNMGSGCSSPGDGIDDTPPVLVPLFGCPTGTDSCPDQPGVDPIHNFMAYTDDYCQTEFTQGQIDRTWSNWHRYREGK
ncbi:metalloprotease protein [Purpureocillium lavendulum]|uniref:Metalloprotease protein n=1 Tax=Purpureocillium lavendulum TaxID=1247861 RepID=A0AB34FBH2_9HYPO|nr:metalloprotease protein [Purpureocillium lavendulum]